MALTSIILLLLWTAMPSKCESKFNTIYANNRPALAKINYGVIFRPIQRHFIATDSIHHLYFHLKFPHIHSLPEMPVLTEQHCHAMTNFMLESRGRRIMKKERSQSNVTSRMVTTKRDICLQEAIFIQEFHKRYTAFVEQIDHSYKSLKLMLAIKAKKNERQKRALLSFLTPLWSGIFGLASTKDVKQIQENMEALLYNQNIMSNSTRQLRDRVITLANATSARIDNMWKAITKVNDNAFRTQQVLRNITTRTADYLNQIDTNIYEVLNWLKQSSVIHDNINLMLMDCAVVKDKLEVWHSSIQDLASGVLPHRLISQKDVRDALLQVKRTLQIHYPNFHLVHDEEDIQYYYLNDISTSFVRWNDRDLEVIVHVGLPISTLTNKFDIYSVELNPVPIRHNISTAHDIGFTMLDKQSIPEFFVLTSDNQFFTEMTITEYLYCANLQDSTCPLLRTIYNSQRGSCVGALFFDRNDEITSRCKFNIYPNRVLDENIVYIDHSTYLITTADKQYDLMCPGVAKQTYKATHAMITVPCACEINTSNLNLPPSLAACSQNQNTDIIISFPQNAAMLQLFQLDNEKLNEPAETETNLIIPNDFDIEQFQTLKDKEQQFKLDFQTAALVSSTQNIQLKRFKPVKYYSWIDWTNIMVYIALGVTAFNLAVLILFTVKMHFKLKTIWPVLAILTQQLQNKTVKAGEIANTEKLCKPEYSSNSFAAVIILGLIVILYLAWRIYKTYGKCNNKQCNNDNKACTQLLFILSDFVLCSTIQIATFPVCIDKVSILQLSEIADVHIKFRLGSTPKVKIQWNNALKVKCDAVYFEFDPISQYVPMPKAIVQLLQRALYLPQEVRQKLFAGYRLQCSCCKKARHVTNTNFTPRKLQNFAVVSHETRNLLEPTSAHDTA